MSDEHKEAAYKVIGSLMELLDGTLELIEAEEWEVAANHAATISKGMTDQTLVWMALAKERQS